MDTYLLDGQCGSSASFFDVSVDLANFIVSFLDLRTNWALQTRIGLFTDKIRWMSSTPNVRFSFISSKFSNKWCFTECFLLNLHLKMSGYSILIMLARLKGWDLGVITLMYSSLQSQPGTRFSIYRKQVSQSKCGRMANILNWPVS